MYDVFVAMVRWCASKAYVRCGAVCRLNTPSESHSFSMKIDFSSSFFSPFLSPAVFPPKSTRHEIHECMHRATDRKRKSSSPREEKMCRGEAERCASERNSQFSLKYFSWFAFSYVLCFGRYFSFFSCQFSFAEESVYRPQGFLLHNRKSV